jgi:hypothetical protein
MDGSGIGRAMDGMVYLLKAAIPLSILGLWKLVDIVLWVIRNVQIEIGGRF